MGFRYKIEEYDQKRNRWGLCCCWIHDTPKADRVMKRNMGYAEEFGDIARCIDLLTGEIVAFTTGKVL